MKILKRWWSKTEQGYTDGEIYRPIRESDFLRYVDHVEKQFAKVKEENKMEIDYKYNEEKYLDELEQYVNSTYDQHYSQGKFQATEEIIDDGHGRGFCLGNVKKYAKRYGKKGTPADYRKDLMKVLHYALIMLYVHDLEYGENEDNPD